MKKTLVAAALLAGFTGAAHAQSSVTLFGVADGGFGYTKVDGKSRSGIDSGLQTQSRWGLRGTEDVGNGLKAIFLLDSGYTIDDGALVPYGSASTKLFGRNAYVGLESTTAGRLIFGRTYNLSFTWTAPIANPFGLSFSTATLGTAFGYQDADLGAGRPDNTVYYFTPVFSGFQGAIGYSFAPNAGVTTAVGGGNEVPGSKNNDRLANIGIKYDRGPLKAAVTFEYLRPNESTANNGNLSNLTLGADYDFGVVTLYGGYARINNIRSSGYNSPAGINTGFVTPTRNDDTGWTIGLTAPVGGPGKVYAAYQRATKSDVGQWALGYMYALSKRTSLYTFYADTQYRNFTQNRNFGANQFAAGVVHYF